MSNSSFKLPIKYVLLLDDLVRKGFFESRGEAVRIALEDYINFNYKEFVS